MAAAADPEKQTGSSDGSLDARRDADYAKDLEQGTSASDKSQPSPTADDDSPVQPETSTPANDDGGNNNSNTSKGSTAAAANDASQPEHPEPEASRTKLETFLVVFALCLAVFLAALDMTIITTAIPTIAAQFNSSLGYIWVGGAFLLGNASFATMWGKISDIFGRKPVLLAAVAVFWIGSLLCAISRNMGMLIASRAIQGVGGGGAIVLPNICISDLFSMRSRGMYFGIIGMVWAIASAVGPVLGGVFTDKVTWRWCFYINLPISAVGFFILLFFLKLHNPRTPVRQGLAAVDWSGSLLVIGGTIMLLIGLEFGGVTHPWRSATVICLIVFGAATIGLFLVNEWKVAKYPLTPLHLFRSRTNAAAYAMAFLHAMTFMSGSYWLPLYFQGVLGATSLMSGVYILPFVLSLSFVSAAAGVIIKKTGNYQVLITVGMAIATVGFGLLIDLGARANWAKIIVFQIIAGIGIGPNFQAPLIALQASIRPSDIGSATACFSFLRQLGTSVSVAVGGVIFNNEMQRQQATLQRELGPELAARLSGANAAGSVQVVAALEGHEGQVARQAYWNAMRTMYIVYTVFSTMAFLTSLLIRQVNLSRNHQEHKTGLATLKERGAGPAGGEDEAGVAADEKR